MEPVITASVPLLEPPGWAIAQRQLFDLLDDAWRRFAHAFTGPDGRLNYDGSLSTRDGVDDFYEVFFNWPQLYLLGGLFVNNRWAFVFDYRVTLTLVPVNGTDVNSALTAQTTGAGTLQLAWLGTPPAGGDAIKAFIAQGMEPQLRANVVSTARPLVNDAVVQNHDVRWWTEQGFSVSVRRVTYSGSDLKVSAALCRLS